VYSSESKEKNRGEGLEGSQETEGCKGKEEEEEDVGVPPTTLRQNARGRDHSIRGELRRREWKGRKQR